MKLPKVSILLFFAKDRGWMQQARESVYNQTYQGEIELLRSDLLNPDHSKMNTSENLNFLIKKAKGKFIKYLCEDDELTPISIEASVEAMLEQGCDFLHGNSINRHTQPDGGYVDKLYYPRLTEPTIPTICEGNYVHGGTLFYKAELFKQGFKFDETINTAEEMDLTMHLLKSGKKMGYCNKFLYIYRRHDHQKSLGKAANQVERAKVHEEIKNRYR